MFNDLLLNLLKGLGGNVNDILLIILVLLTLFWLLKYDILRLLNIRKGLKLLNKRISDLEGYDAGNIKKIDVFFNSKMNSGLKNAWIACYYDFIHLMNKEKTLDIRQYFNINSVITVPAGRKRAEAVPGIISLAGVLGTFLGIMSGLSNLDPAAANERMGGFLNIISSSFSIFIAALILSMVFQLLDRQFYHLTVSELNSFLNLVSRKIPMANESGSLELLIKEQRSEKEALENMGVNISEQLNAFVGRELVPSIHKAFDDAIKTQVTPSIKSMSDMLYQLSEAAYNTQRKGMQIMVDSFISKLMTTTGLELDKLGTSFKSIMEQNSRVAEHVELLIKKLSENSELQKDVNTQTIMVLETIGGYQHQAVEMNSAIRANLEGMNSFNESVRNLLQSDSKMVEELDGQRQEIRKESTEYFSKMDEQIGKLLEDLSIQLDAAFSHFNEITAMAFERLDSSLNASVEGMSSNIRTLTENMDDQVRDISIYARGLSEEIGELNLRLENSIKEFGSQMNEGVGKTIEAFDSGLAEICGRLGRAISNIKDAVEDLPAVMTAMKSYKEEKQEMVG